MKRVEKANKILDRLASRTGLTEDGKKWLIAVLDPFHDEKLDCQGYPDRNTGVSVVQVVKQSIDFSTPYTNGQVWGAHILIGDTLAPSYYYKHVGEGNVLYPPVAGQTDYTVDGGVQIIGNPPNPNTDLIIPNSPSNSTNKYIGNVYCPLSYFGGKSRVLSVGVELRNTTPELYKGGSLCVYEQPTSKTDWSTYVVQDTSFAPSPDDIKKYGEENIYVEPAHTLVVLDHTNEDGTKDLQHFKTPKKIEAVKKFVPTAFFVVENGKRRDLDVVPTVAVGVRSLRLDTRPPESVADALLLPDSKQWETAKGVYMALTMNDLENPPSFPDFVGTLFVPGSEDYYPHMEDTDVTGELYTEKILSNIEFPQWGTINTMASLKEAARKNVVADDPTFNPTFGSYKANKRMPFHRKGIILTGLSAQSTFTLNLNVVIERFLANNDRDLIVLCKPSPCEDYMATALYSEICRVMPVAVEVSENGAGDWFLGIVDEIANVASSIGNPLLAGLNAYQATRKASSSPFVSNPSFKNVSNVPPQQKRKQIAAPPKKMVINHNAKTSPYAGMSKGQIKRAKAMAKKQLLLLPAPPKKSGMNDVD